MDKKRKKNKRAWIITGTLAVLISIMVSYYFLRPANLSYRKVKPGQAVLQPITRSPAMLHQRSGSLYFPKSNTDIQDKHGERAGGKSRRCSACYR